MKTHLLLKVMLMAGLLLAGACTPDGAGGGRIHPLERQDLRKHQRRGNFHRQIGRGARRHVRMELLRRHGHPRRQPLRLVGTRNLHRHRRRQNESCLKGCEYGHRDRQRDGGDLYHLLRQNRGQGKRGGDIHRHIECRRRRHRSMESLRREHVPRRQQVWLVGTGYAHGNGPQQGESRDRGGEHHHD